MAIIDYTKVWPFKNQADARRISKNTADTTEEIWDGSTTYVWPTTALMTHFSQTTNQAAMVNATIEAQGLDASWDAVTQTKTFNGSDTTTAIAWDTPMLRCFRLKVLANVVCDSPIKTHLQCS